MTHDVSAVVDKNVGGDQVLASTQTAGDGGYAVSRLITARYLADHHKSAPDLQVQVLAGGSVIGTSGVSYSASATVSLITPTKCLFSLVQLRAKSLCAPPRI